MRRVNWKSSTEESTSRSAAASSSRVSVGVELERLADQRFELVALVLGDLEVGAHHLDEERGGGEPQALLDLRLGARAAEERRDALLEEAAGDRAARSSPVAACPLSRGSAAPPPPSGSRRRTR